MSNATEYEDFIQTKLRQHVPTGIAVSEEAIHPRLFGHQKAITRWALRLGRAACFASTGLGKTAIEAEFAQQVHLHTGGQVLIYCPLAVAQQTIDEAKLQNVQITQVRFAEELREGIPGVYITNFDRFKHFEGVPLAGLVIDESGILKDFNAKTRDGLIEQAQGVPFRLACTATPAPNDQAELGNHAEFLSVMTRVEMLATYFINTGESTARWRLKRHGQREFYRWLASWAVFLRKPSDIGFSDEGYDLPPLDIEEVVVQCNNPPEGMLFATGALEGVTGRAAMRRSTLEDRVEATARLIEAEPDENWILWTGLNDESDALEKRLRDVIPLVRVEGRDTEEEKVERIQAFCRGNARLMITKPRVAAWGLNLQHSARQAFVGIGDSFELYFQCLRRQHRFGQKKHCKAYIVVSEAERAIVENVKSKEAEATFMGDQILEHMSDLSKAALEAPAPRVIPPGYITTTRGNDWTFHHGDCIEVLANRDLIADESVHFSVQSPPFATLFTYSNNPRDMGNSRDHEEFFEQFQHWPRNLMRVIMPGRMVAVHVSQVGSTQATHGRTGLFDFRGPVIETFLRMGWNYYCEVCIDRCPQAVAIRTKAKKLLFAQLKRDRSWSGPAIPDYILVFRKPGVNPIPIQGGIDQETWIQWARPIWYNLQETRTLNAAEGRGELDERHVCPLSLDTIQRCVRLWSNEGETVLSSFGGIGSEGYESLLWNRRFIGIELKPEYYRTALTNLRRAEQMRGQQSLFDGLEAS